MIQVLEPLTQIPGVRVAVLVTPDGVPVAIRGKLSDIPFELEGESNQEMSLDEEAGSMAGLSIHWLQELTRSAGLLSCEGPRRVVLTGARGTLVLLHAPGGILLTILDRGASPEDLRLPMEGAVARMQRILRNMGSTPELEVTDEVQESQPPGPLPQRTDELGGLTLKTSDSSDSTAPGSSGDR